MILSEKKASAALKPWWDIIYGHGLLALLGLGILLLFTTSQHTKIHDSLPKSALEPETKPTEAAGQSLEDNNRSTQLQSNIDTQHNQFPEDKVVPNLNDDNDLPNNIESVEELEADESVFTIYTLFLFVILWLLETLFSRLFYTSHLVQIICHILESLSDVREFRRVGQGLIFAGTIHHSHNKTHLWFIFILHKVLRLLFVLVSLIVVAHFHVVDLSNPLSEELVTSRGSFAIGVLIILVLLVQLAVCVYSVAWPWLLKQTTWGKLMINYAIGLDKIDIARGRSVPAPAYGGNISSTLRRNLAMVSEFNFVPSAFRGIFAPSRKVRQKPTHHGRRQRSKPVKVVDSLNPYIASANVRLVLDLVASRSGVGLALRCLSFLEMDVQNNWKPFKPFMQFISYDQNSQEPKHLHLIWRDPLAVLYLTPVPRELELHYGIEITFLKPSKDLNGESLVVDETRDQVVEIVGYDETRFFRNMNNKSTAPSPAAVQTESDNTHLTVGEHVNQQRNSRSMHWQPDLESGSICSYSVLGGGDGSISHLEESFTYREEFLDVTELDGDFNVVIWTIVDGQLIAKNSVSTQTSHRLEGLLNGRCTETDNVSVGDGVDEPTRIVIEDTYEEGETMEQDVIIEKKIEDSDAKYENVEPQVQIDIELVTEKVVEENMAQDNIELQNLPQSQESLELETTEQNDIDENEPAEPAHDASDEDFEKGGVTGTQRHSILVETPSSSSSDEDVEKKRMEEGGRKKPKVKIRRKCLRTQSTSELPQLGVGGLTKGIRKVHSSSSFHRMSSLEEPSLKVKQRPISRHNLPKVTINAPECENKSQSSSSLSENSVASSCNPSPIPVIREEGGSINEAFIMDSDSNDDENNDSNKKPEVLEMLI